MSQKLLIEQLKLREQALERELNAIRVLIGTYEEETQESNKEDLRQNPESNLIVPKGDVPWEEYAVYLLEKLGGVATASEVGDLAVKANSDLPQKTVKAAIRNKLSKSYQKGDVVAIKPKNRKDGNTYRLKMRRTKFPESSE